MKIKLRITIILISALCIFNGLLTPGAYAAAANGYVANKKIYVVFLRRFHHMRVSLQ